MAIPPVRLLTTRERRRLYRLSEIGTEWLMQRARRLPVPRNPNNAAFPTEWREPDGCLRCRKSLREHWSEGLEA